MSLIPYANILMGSFNGIASCKHQPIDYKILGLYYGIITPYQLFNTYNNLDIVQKIRLQGVKPYVYIPTTLSMLMIGNACVFGLSYIVGKTGCEALLSPKQLS